MTASSVSTFFVAALALAACSSNGNLGGVLQPSDAGTTPGVDVRTNPGTDAGGNRSDGSGGGNIDAAASCATATSCGACTPMGACGWCGRTGRCMPGGSSGSTDMSCTGADWAWVASRCGADGGVLPPVDAAAQCAMATTCSACAALPSCGWCGRTGRCMVGTSSGSGDMACSGADWAYTPTRCGADGGVLPAPDVPPSCDGVPRSCGLTRSGDARTCTAGQMVTVGCSSACGLGSCTGDAVIQICPGDATAACTGMAVVASNDDAPSTAMCNRDAGSNLCPIVTFMCPSSGRYTVWTGAYDAEDMATCTVAVR